MFSVVHEHNESQYSAVKYLDKCFSSLQTSFMQYNYEDTSPDLFKQMFKMAPFGFYTSKKTLLPLAYGCVDAALVDSFSDRKKAFMQFIDMLLVGCHNLMTIFLRWFDNLLTYNCTKCH